MNTPTKPGWYRVRCAPTMTEFYVHVIMSHVYNELRAWKDATSYELSAFVWIENIDDALAERDRLRDELIRTKAEARAAAARYIEETEVSIRTDERTRVAETIRKSADRRYGVGPGPGILQHAALYDAAALVEFTKLTDTDPT